MFDFQDNAEFATFAEADAYLRQRGFSAITIETDDHYAVYASGQRSAEIGPGSISGPDGNWRVSLR